MLDVVDFDIDSKIDWLSSYHMVLVYFTKTTTLAMPNIPLDVL